VKKTGLPEPITSSEAHQWREHCFEGKKKPGNPHLRGPSGFLEQLENQLNSLLLQVSGGWLCLDNMMPVFKDHFDPCTDLISP